MIDGPVDEEGRHPQNIASLVAIDSVFFAVDDDHGAKLQAMQFFAA